MPKIQTNYEIIAKEGSYVTDSKYVSYNNKDLKTTLENMPILDESGKIPSYQLPSYVDDVIECPKKSMFPIPGESGKIYIDTESELTYRWSGSGYVEISPSIALGETASTAYAGNKGKQTTDNLATHVSDDVRHITAEEREKWNSSAATLDQMFTIVE